MADRWPTPAVGVEGAASALSQHAATARSADVTAASGIVHRDYGMGACAGDVDNDGRIDLYVTSYGAERRSISNAGNGAFADMTRTAGVGLSRWSTSCAFLDVDRDGDLDLFVANYLDAAAQQQPVLRRPAAADSRLLPSAQLHGAAERALSQRRQGCVHRRQRGGRHREVSSATVSASPSATTTMTAGRTCSWPTTPCRISCSTTTAAAASREVGLAAGVAVGSDGKARAGMGTEFADYNGDGRLDLVVTNHEFETHSLFRNEGKGTFADASVESGIACRRCLSSALASPSSTATTTATSISPSPTAT